MHLQLRDLPIGAIFARKFLPTSTDVIVRLEVFRIIPVIGNHTSLSANRSEAGATMVEAAVVLPLLLVIMITIIQIAIFCFHILRFQYEVSEITRQTFSLRADHRATVAGQVGIMGWRPFLESRINLQAQAIGLATREPTTTASAIFAHPDGTCAAWSCAEQAVPGWVFSLSIRLEEPIFGSRLANISWAKFPFTVNAIAFVQFQENDMSV